MEDKTKSYMHEQVIKGIELFMPPGDHSGEVHSAAFAEAMHRLEDALAATVILAADLPKDREPSESDAKAALTKTAVLLAQLHSYSLLCSRNIEAIGGPVGQQVSHIARTLSTLIAAACIDTSVEKEKGERAPG